MLRKIVKPVGGLMMGWSLASGAGASAQTLGQPIGSIVAPQAAPPAPMTVAPPAASTPVPTTPVPGSSATHGYVDHGSVAAGPATSCFGGNNDCWPGVWVNIDYIMWWMKAAPAPGPIVTTGSLLDPVPGAIGQPNTVVVLGNRSLNNENPYSGARLEVGTWIDEGRHWGFEASGFAVDQRRTTQGVGSDPNGVPFLARPIFNTQLNQEDIITLSVPGFQAGALSMTSATRLSGFDFNGLVNGVDMSNFRADYLLGFRALYLSESLSISDSVTALADQGPAPALQTGENMRTSDNYRTSSNFFGGQLGTRLTWVADRWIATGTFKFGLGVTEELATLTGSASTRNNGAPIPSGILVYPGNAARYYQTDFAIVPELNLNIGYRLTRHISLRAGYTFLYWSDVVRPGNVVSRSVNPGLNPNLTAFGTGPQNTTPLTNFQSTDFWTQGLNVGFEFRF